MRGLGRGFGGRRPLMWRPRPLYRRPWRPLFGPGCGCIPLALVPLLAILGLAFFGLLLRIVF